MQFPPAWNRNTPRPPPSPLSYKFWSENAVLHFSCLLNLLPHRKYVSHCLLFFFNPRRKSKRGFDLLDNRLRLPAGLGDLPLYPEEDGWYSVRGPWKGTTDNPDDVNQDNPEVNPDIPPALVNPPRNARPDPTLIFCEYPKRSGNRFAPPLSPLLYSHRGPY